MDPEVHRLLRAQEGVVARRQLVDCDVSATHQARLLRRGELVVVTPGVYVNHNGPLTWLQRAWAAVLQAAPAALCLESSLSAVEGTGPWDTRRPIHVAVDRSRKLRAPLGIVVHRRSDLDAVAEWHRSPPRVGYDDTVIDLASRSGSDLDAVALLARACGSRRTTARRLRVRLDARSRIARRAWLESVLDDVEAGTQSVLEHGYQARVVRPHGLPTGLLQVSDEVSGGRVYRDVVLPALAVVVELDGARFHTAPEDRDRDLDRDLATLAREEQVTVRLGWGQVFGRPCATAARLGALLMRRGWPGPITSCAHCGGLREAG